MLDAAMRKLIDPPLDAAARRLGAVGVRANAITLGGLAVGLAAVPLIAAEWYAAALAAVLVNRLADGLDGALARQTGPTDLGGYLDIVGDYLFYAAVPFGFALARAENALPAAFLIFAFMGTGASFLAYAIVAAKRRLTTVRRGSKAFFYLGGLTEGTETIAVFVAFCLFPGAFAILAYGFGALCWATTLWRMAAAGRAFRD